MEVADAEVQDASAQLWSAAVLDAVWRASAGVRRSRHRGAGQAGCPARGAPGVEGREPLVECVRTGCADVFQELSVGVVGQLRAAGQASGSCAGQPTWTPAWLAAVARNELVDQQRTSRVRSGMPARPTRSEGAAAEVEAAIEALSTDSRQLEWFLALFRMMRGHVCRTDRTSVGWPVESWAGEKALRLGGLAVAPAEVAADIRWVLDVAAQSVGAAWVRRRLLLPLTGVREDGADLDRVLSRLSVEDQAMVAIAAGTFRSSRRSGVPVPQAWREAVRLVGGAADGRPQAWVVELLEGYEVA